MLSRTFDSVFDQALQMMQAGASIDACVASYPQYGADLRAQLQMVNLLAAVRPQAAPAPAARSQGRARLLAAVAEQRLAPDETPLLGFVAPLGALFAGARRFVLLPQALPAALALLILSGTWLGVSAATGEADPTAPIRGLFTRSSEAHIELRGTIAALGPDSLTIASPSGDLETVRITDETELEDDDGTPLALTDFGVGDAVKVRAVRSDDGSLIADEVEREREEGDQDRSGPGDGEAQDATDDHSGPGSPNSGPGNVEDEDEGGDEGDENDGDNPGPGNADDADDGDDDHSGPSPNSGPGNVDDDDDDTSGPGGGGGSGPGEGDGGGDDDDSGGDHSAPDGDGDRSGPGSGDSGDQEEDD